MRFSIILICMLCISFVIADDSPYAPYIHDAQIPENPGLKLNGRYDTELFIGSSVYSYPIKVPEGVNGVKPNSSVISG